MIKIRKFSNLNSKKLFIALFSCVVMNQGSAQMATLPVETLTLATKIETSDLKTQDYIWKFELRGDGATKKITAKLLNPHPKLQQLNKRALELAHEVSFEQLDRAYIKQYAEQYRAIPTSPLTPESRFDFEVKFISNIGYKRQPSKEWTERFARQICQLDLELPVYQKVYDPETNRLFLNLKFQVTKTGEISAYTVLNDPKYPEGFLNLHQLINQYQFYSVNQNGQPISFMTTQPFNFDCSNITPKEKYRNKYQ